MIADTSNIQKVSSQILSAGSTGIKFAIFVFIPFARIAPVKIAQVAPLYERVPPVIRPLLDHPLIEFIGEIGEKEKKDFLAKAYALLFPIDWSEPFGLVMIEAMACGTPVVAYPRGSVTEVIEDGITGFLAHSIEAAVRALDKIQHFDRERCRKMFEERFSVERMTHDYVEIYEKLRASASARKPSGTPRISVPTAVPQTD